MFSGHICVDAIRMVVCSGIPFCGSIHHAAIPKKTFWWTANQGVSFLFIPSFIYLYQNFGESIVFTLANKNDICVNQFQDIIILGGFVFWSIIHKISTWI